MGSRKKGRLEKTKTMSRLRDADLSGRSASCDPAMVFGFRMASILSGSYGRLARCAQPPDCCWTVSRHEREHRIAVFAHHAPDANHHWPAPDMRVSLDQKA